MKYLLIGRSRFTGTTLQVQIEAPSAEDAIARAERLGLCEVEVQHMVMPDQAAIASSFNNASQRMVG